MKHFDPMLYPSYARLTNKIRDLVKNDAPQKRIDFLCDLQNEFSQYIFHCLHDEIEPIGIY